MLIFTNSLWRVAEFSKAGIETVFTALVVSLMLLRLAMQHLQVSPDGLVNSLRSKISKRIKKQKLLKKNLKMLRLRVAQNQKLKRLLFIMKSLLISKKLLTMQRNQLKRRVYSPLLLVELAD